MARKQVKKVNFEVRRGIMINGSPIYPDPKGKAKKIITINENFAKDLVLAGKGVVTDAKPNVEIKEPSEDDDLDDAFGSEGDQE